MKTYIKHWMWAVGFYSLFCVYQMFFSSVNRIVLIGSYANNLVFAICYALVVLRNIKLIDENSSLKMEKFKKDAEESQRKIRDFPHGSEWQCDICKRLRIDALIGVVKYQDESKLCTYHIRHCRDDLNCISKSLELSYMYGEKVFIVGTTE